MKTPARSAAAMTISPLWAVTSRPSRVKVTVSGCGGVTVRVGPGCGEPTVEAPAGGRAAAEEAADVPEEGGVDPDDPVEGSDIRAAAFLHVEEELVSEHGDRRVDRGGDRRAEHAD